MEVDGAPYAPRSPRDARGRGIALIHQELSLFPHLTVAENVLMGQEPSRRGLWDRAEARRRTREVLAEFGHPEIDPDARVGRLPIGARQVVEICRAIAARARVVLMDEPTSSLPRGDVDRLFATIGRLSAAGVAVVYISHFLEETRAVASAFTVLRDGRTVGTGALVSVTNDQLIALMVGRTVGELFPRREGRPSDDVGARGRRPRRPRPPRGLVHPAPRRGARRLRPHGLGADRDGAGPLRPRPPGGRSRERGRARARPRRPAGAAARRRPRATSARTARARASPSPSPSPTT